MLDAEYGERPDILTGLLSDNQDVISVQGKFVKPNDLQPTALCDIGNCVPFLIVYRLLLTGGQYLSTSNAYGLGILGLFDRFIAFIV